MISFQFIAPPRLSRSRPRARHAYAGAACEACQAAPTLNRLKHSFFPSPAPWRRWLAAHHDKKNELWVGFYKRASGMPSITWPEAVDEALCFGWIDGVRHRIDDERYAIRFT